MTQPQYRLEGIVHTRNEGMEDFEGPLDVIFLLLNKNKIESVSIWQTLTSRNIVFETAYLSFLAWMTSLLSSCPKF